MHTCIHLWMHIWYASFNSFFMNIWHYIFLQHISINICILLKLPIILVVVVTICWSILNSFISVFIDLCLVVITSSARSYPLEPGCFRRACGCDVYSSGCWSGGGCGELCKLIVFICKSENYQLLFCSDKDGDTPLGMIAETGKDAAVPLLLVAGADIYIRNKVRYRIDRFWYKYY